MIGDLSHLLTLQERTLTPDGGGGFTMVWQDVASVPTLYAAVEALSGGERQEALQLVSAVTHRITLRYREDVSADMRFVEGSAVYYIMSAQDPDGTKKRLQVIAELKSA